MLKIKNKKWTCLHVSPCLPHKPNWGPLHIFTTNGSEQKWLSGFWFNDSP